MELFMGANLTWDEAQEIFNLREMTEENTLQHGDIARHNVVQLFVKTCPKKEKMWRSPTISFAIGETYDKELRMMWTHRQESAWCQYILKAAEAISSNKGFDLMAPHGGVAHISPDIMLRSFGKTGGFTLSFEPAMPTKLMRALEEKIALSVLQDNDKPSKKSPRI